MITVMVSDRELERRRLQEMAYRRQMGERVERPPVPAIKSAPVIEPPLEADADEVRKALEFYRKHLERSKAAQQRYREKRRGK